MVITSINAGDVVECDVRGVTFFATVTERDKGQLTIKPHLRTINHYHVKANQVVGHYKKMGRSR